MNIIDIHTHVMPQQPGTALVCIGYGPIPEDALEQGHLFSAGLHPWDVTDSFENQLFALEETLANPRVPAIGECGFDTLKGPSHELQERAFIRQTELSEQFHKPMILHVVRDFDSVIRLRKLIKPAQSWLIHGYRGGPEQMNRLYAQGILVSFGLKHNPDAIRQIPLDRLFLETDGKCSIRDVIDLAAAQRAERPETIIQQLAINSKRFLSYCDFG